ncbi:MAG: DUF2797 domain-containing protein [Schleiferiaceae bacterium]|nr:DUF2797 domain-containing protein [Schleiferiaceae bacterium]
MNPLFLLKKMRAVREDGRALYYLDAGSMPVAVHSLVGKELTLEATGKRVCNGCQKEVEELFRMGYCRSCFFTHPAAGASLVSPEKSTAHLGIEDRDLAYEQALQLQPHVVYLAHTGAVKVGVTRAQQPETRWLDQGATEAIVLAQTTNRYEAGLLEVHLKNYFPDKTQWQSLVKGSSSGGLDWNAERTIALEHFQPEWMAWVVERNEPWRVDYPVVQYATKPSYLSLEKTPEFTGRLSGIRGQYLIFEDSRVFNVRGHEGHEVRLRVRS